MRSPIAETVGSLARGLSALLCCLILIAIPASASGVPREQPTEQLPSARPTVVMDGLLEPGSRPDMAGAQVSTASQSALQRIQPQLRELMSRAGPDQRLFVSLWSEGPVALGGIGAGAISYGFPWGETGTFLRALSHEIISLAQAPGVKRIESAEPSQPPYEPLAGEDGSGPPEPSREELRARWQQLQSSDVPWSESKLVDRTIALRQRRLEERRAAMGRPSVGGARAVPQPHQQPDAWYDVAVGHRTRAAWERGWRGEGVKVAVVDSGVDMAHPELQGTWHEISAPGTGLDGWPQAFDPYSNILYATQGVNSGRDGVSRLVAMAYSGEPNAQGEACFPRLRHNNNTLLGTREDQPVCDWKVTRTSRSGTYRYGNSPDFRLGQIHGERPGILLVDENRAGVYDTVYVDLDNDHDFTDEKPANRADPVIYRDMDGDGWPDLSHGIVYFIADGRTGVPGSWMLSPAPPVPAAYSVVGFMSDWTDSHGTFCASNVVAQGAVPVAERFSLRFRDLPSDGRPVGVVIGAAPGASLIPIGNYYSVSGTASLTAVVFAARGFDPNDESDDAQIVSNSYGGGGYGTVDIDGWDDTSRYLDALIRQNRDTSFLYATGNGGPGYGTVVPPKAAAAIQVAASTQMGSTGFDSITSTHQITFGDIIPFSNRGPGALGSNGPHVAAQGAYGSGAVPLNSTQNGLVAWSDWGGTSRSTPVAAGNLALVYQAFQSEHNRWPTWEEARAILMGGARYSGYDTYVQGAGVVDGGRAAFLAGGVDGLYAMPPEWIAGGYDGQPHAMFANILHPGQSDTASIELHNPTQQRKRAELHGVTLRRIYSREFAFSSKPAANETPYNQNAPDYLIALDRDEIPWGTELMAVRAIYPLEQFDPGGNYNANNANRWRLLVYQHTDIDGDGTLWHDQDGDGVVDKSILSRSTSVDGARDLDWSATEMDRWEYERLSMNNSVANNLAVWVHHPLERWRDGLYIGLQHGDVNSQGQPIRRTVSVTQITLRIEFYTHQDWDWLTLSPSSVSVPARGRAEIDAQLEVPPAQALGSYQGAIFVDWSPDEPEQSSIFLPSVQKQAGGPTRLLGLAVPEQVSDPVSDLPYQDSRLVIPVGVNVAADWQGQPSVTMGGPDGFDEDAPYNNAAVRGTFNWFWRAESGDYRLFFLDVNADAAPGTRLAVRNIWPGGPPTDIDSLLYAPQRDTYSDNEPQRYGPHGLGLVAASANGQLSGAVWRFLTATGGSEEWVVATPRRGLHELVLHNVLFSGTQTEVPFEATAGLLSQAPSAVERVDAGCTQVELSSGIDLANVQATGYGLISADIKPSQQVRQDSQGNVGSASFKSPINVRNSGRLRVSLSNPGAANADLDLYLTFALGGGQYALAAGSVTRGSSNEAIEVLRPPDRTYEIWVHGYNVPGGQTTFTLNTENVTGDNLTVRGMAPAWQSGEAQSIEVCASLPSGTVRYPLMGDVFIGPATLPTLFRLPVTLTR